MKAMGQNKGARGVLILALHALFPFMGSCFPQREGGKSEFRQCWVKQQLMVAQAGLSQSVPQLPMAVTLSMKENCSDAVPRHSLRHSSQERKKDIQTIKPGSWRMTIIGCSNGKDSKFLGQPE